MQRCSERVDQVLALKSEIMRLRRKRIDWNWTIYKLNQWQKTAKHVDIQGAIIKMRELIDEQIKVA